MNELKNSFFSSSFLYCFRAKYVRNAFTFSMSSGCICCAFSAEILLSNSSLCYRIYPKAEYQYQLLRRLHKSVQLSRLGYELTEESFPAWFPALARYAHRPIPHSKGIEGCRRAQRTVCKIRYRCREVFELTTQQRTVYRRNRKKPARPYPRRRYPSPLCRANELRPKIRPWGKSIV